jgi:hypothetical protein
MPVAALLFSTGLAAAAAPATPGGALCEIELADPVSLGWVRIQQASARVAERCQPGDVMALHAVGDGHAADLARLAGMACRFDAPILTFDQGAGARRLLCVFSGRFRAER